MIAALALSWATTAVACLVAWVERVGRRAAAAQSRQDADMAHAALEEADRWHRRWRDLASADAGQLSDGAMTALMAAVHEPTPDPDTTQPLPRPGICVWPPYVDRRPR